MTTEAGWRHKVLWIVVTALIGAMVSLLLGRALKDKHEVSIERWDSSNKDGMLTGVELKNSGTLPLRNAIVELDIQLDAKPGETPVREVTVQDAINSCSPIKEQPYLDVGIHPMLLVRWSCPILNPEEEINVYLRYDQRSYYGAAVWRPWMMVTFKADGYTLTRAVEQPRVDP